jgi:hypothetical protein
MLSQCSGYKYVCAETVAAPSRIE